jgi:hypothetical protein
MDIDDFSSGNFFVQGELGAGKTMFSVMLIKEYMAAGRPVATNLDIFLENMMLPESKKTLIRLPDKPSVHHLEQLGTAYDLSEGYDESKFGLIVLDECLTWLNTRGYNDKERPAVVDWFLHARKKGWNICFLLQHIDFADKQIVDTLLTYHVVCRKLAKYRVPIVGKLFGLRLPKGTMANIYSGKSNTKMLFGREFYRGTDLYNCYNTAQVFQSGFVMSKDGHMIDMRGNSTVLSAWHLKGRYSGGDKVFSDFDWNRFLKWIGYNVLRPLVIWIYRFVPRYFKQAWQIDLTPISY